MSSIIFAASILAAAACFPVAAQTKTTLDGVYTDAQAERGATIFEQRCARCHGGDLLKNLSAPLQGKGFIDLWREDTVDAIYSYIQAKMPKGGESPVIGDNPRSIGDAAKLDALTFLLKMSDFPAGSVELTPAAMPDILFVGPDGPKPLPNLSDVVVVGCLTPANGGDWTLAQVGSIKRTYNPLETTPDDLKRAAAKPLGTQTVRIQNLADINFDAAANRGHRVSVKGVLYTSPTSVRVNATSAASVSASCTP